MFYLGSIAGILPYLLAFSLTIVWGGHASLPLFAAATAPGSPKEIVKEIASANEKIKSFKIDFQIVAEKISALPIYFFSLVKVFNYFLSLLFNSKVPGINLLRAPPLSLF